MPWVTCVGGTAARRACCAPRFWRGCPSGLRRRRPTVACGPAPRWRAGWQANSGSLRSCLNAAGKRSRRSTGRCRSRARAIRPRPRRRSGRRSKKLRRQSELSGLAFQVGEIGVRITAKAALERTGVASPVEALADALPADAIDARQIAYAGRGQSGPGPGDQAHRAAHHGSGRGRLATGGPALVIAAGAEGLLKSIVGLRQIGHLIAVEQPGPITARYLPEMVDRASKRSGFGAMATHRAEQPVEAAAHNIC